MLQERASLSQDVYCRPKGKVSVFLPAQKFDVTITSMNKWTNPPSIRDSQKSKSSVAPTDTTPSMVRVLGQRISKVTLKSFTPCSRDHTSTEYMSPRKRRTTNSQHRGPGKRKETQNFCPSNFHVDPSLPQERLHPDDSSHTCHTSFSSCCDGSSSSLYDVIDQQGFFSFPFSTSNHSNPACGWISLDKISERQAVQEFAHDEAFPLIGWESEDENDIFVDMARKASKRSEPLHVNSSIANKHYLSFPLPPQPSLKRCKAFGSRLNCMETKKVSRVH